MTNYTMQEKLDALSAFTAVIPANLININKDNQIKNILKKENIFLFKNHYKSFKARKLRELLETPTK